MSCAVWCRLRTGIDSQLNLEPGPHVSHGNQKLVMDRKYYTASAEEKDRMEITIAATLGKTRVNLLLSAALIH